VREFKPTWTKLEGRFVASVVDFDCSI
jgi:hypothetical protein